MNKSRLFSKTRRINEPNARVEKQKHPKFPVASLATAASSEKLPRGRYLAILELIFTKEKGGKHRLYR